MSGGFLQIRRNNRTGQRIVRAGSLFLRNRNITARQKVRNAVSAGVAGVSALAKRFGKSKFFSGKGKPPRKLLAGRSKTYTADPTNAITTSPGGGMTKHSITVRMGSRKNLMTKMVKDSKESIVFRFGAIHPFNNTTVASLSPLAITGGGAYALTNWNSLAAAATGTFNHYMPVYVADITSCGNYSEGAVVNAVPFRQLILKGTCTVAGTYPVNSVDFAEVNGKESNGTTSSTAWQLEKSSTQSGPTTYPLASAIQEWSNIKLFCYGAKTRSTRFKVQVVQIKEDDYHPLEVSSYDFTAPSATSGWDELGGIVNFWEGLASASYKHPMATNSTDYRKNLKVIKEYDFIVDPTTTIEERADVGHSKLLNIFIPMYRRNNYNTLASGLETNISDQDNFATANGKNEVYLKPKARVYMIIQATNSTVHNNVSATGTVDDTPSFDMIIRNKFSQLS